MPLRVLLSSAPGGRCGPLRQQGLDGLPLLVAQRPELRAPSPCHPLYTGQRRIVDAEGRVQRFLRKYGMEA